MMQYYAVEKTTNTVSFVSANLYELKNVLLANGKDEENYYILQDLDMKYVSRITFVDDVCVYNNKNFWMSSQPDEIIEDYDNHTVKDFLGNEIGITRFKTEMNNLRSRLSQIDGSAGQVAFNINVANEFIAVFKEETIATDFVDITPDQVMAKLASIVVILLTGSFREAAHAVAYLENDSFLTEERVAKYVDMMTAADAIEYADSGSTVYTASASV